MVFCGVVVFFIYSEDDSEIYFVFCGGGDYDFFRARFQVFLGSFLICEKARSLDNEIYSEVFPRKFFGVSFAENFNRSSVCGDFAFFSLNIVLQGSVVRIVFEQVCESFCVSQIIYGGDVEVFFIQIYAKNFSADSAESVDCDFEFHVGVG